MAVLDVLDLVRVKAAFTDDAGDPADPTTVTFRIRTPAGVESAYAFGGPGGEVVRDGLGLYHVDVTVTESGRWHFRTEGSAPAQAAEESSAYVRETLFELG